MRYVKKCQKNSKGNIDLRNIQVEGERQLQNTMICGSLYCHAMNNKKGAPKPRPLQQPPPRGTRNSTWPTPHTGRGFKWLLSCFKDISPGWRFCWKQFLTLARQIKLYWNLYRLFFGVENSLKVNWGNTHVLNFSLAKWESLFSKWKSICSTRRGDMFTSFRESLRGGDSNFWSCHGCPRRQWIPRPGKTRSATSSML